MIFDFIKKAGEAVFDRSIIGKVFDEEPEKAAKEIQGRVQNQDLNIDGLKAEVKGDKVILTGNAKSAADAEKAILAAGNIEGVAQVESQFSVEKDEFQPQFYTVESGDTLSKIADKFYGDSTQYAKIFEANKPMLSDPDKIYPGQNLRIPAQNQTQTARVA